MKNLVIVGARGFGREVYHLANDMVAAGEPMRIRGFLDDDPDVACRVTGYPPVLGSVEDYSPKANDVFVCALGDVAAKEKYAGVILEKGGRFVSIIHPTAIVRNSSLIEKGCIIQAYSVVSAEVAMGNFVSIQAHTVVGHDVQIGDWSHLSAFVFVGGNAIIGKRVQVFTRATILPKLTIGENAVVGAGSVVIRPVKPGTSVFGNPAVPIYQNQNKPDKSK